MLFSLLRIHADRIRGVRGSIPKRTSGQPPTCQSVRRSTAVPYCDVGRDFTEFSAFRMTFLPVQLLSGAEQERGHLAPCTVVKAEGTLQVSGAVSRKRDSLDSKTNSRMRGLARHWRAVVGIHHHTNLFEKGRRQIAACADNHSFVLQFQGLPLLLNGHRVFADFFDGCF